MPNDYDALETEKIQIIMMHRTEFNTLRLCNAKFLYNKHQWSEFGHFNFIIGKLRKSWFSCSFHTLRCCCVPKTKLVPKIHVVVAKTTKTTSSLITVFENERKSPILHCERSELRLHFGDFLKMKFAVKQCYQMSIGENCQILKNSNVTFWVIFKHCAWCTR